MKFELSKTFETESLTTTTKR